MHSVKSRIKDVEHLRAKIVRKLDQGRELTAANFPSEVTDLAGVRVLHLHLGQFPMIHKSIVSKVEVDRDWVFPEKPVAYTWDPDAARFFGSQGIATEEKDSAYTSIHYLVKAHAESPWTCEIQVRTLFEEIWGEIDHAVNYPAPTEALATREQLRVLAKLVGTGSRLAESIFRIHADASGSKSDD